MQVYLSEEQTTVGAAPFGLLWLLNLSMLICKSEYHLPSGACECIIVESGESYAGGDEALCQAIVVK